MIEYPVYEVKLADGTNIETIFVVWSDDDGAGAIEAGKQALEYMDKKYPESSYGIINIKKLDGVAPEELLDR